MSKTNKVILIGRVGKEPELRKTTQGGSVASVSFVTEDSYKDKNGAYQKASEWHNLSAFGSLADALVKYAVKGSALIIEGHLKTSSWDDKNGGGKKYKTEVIVESWLFQQGNNKGGKSENDSPAESTPAEDGSPDIDSDLPW